MPFVSTLTEAKLDALRRSVSAQIGEYRFRHTLGVEEAIASLGKLYLPNDVLRLRAAALLHDLTKEWTADAQIDFCCKQNIAISSDEIAAPKVLHAKTGAVLAARNYSEYVDSEIITAIREHTVGAWGMSIFSSLLYLADYIEPTRAYPDCVALREAFYKGYSQECRYTHLFLIMARALQLSVDEVRSRGAEPIEETLKALSYFREKSENTVSG